VPAGLVPGGGMSRRRAVVVCGGGGPGTASEAAHALNAGRPLILLAVPPLWREFFCSLDEGGESASDVHECCRLIEARLRKALAGQHRVSL
jgi:hypothetical protein